MAQVISATTKFGAGARGASAGQGSAKRAHFLTQATSLLAESRSLAAAGQTDEALELAYQAALRTAGARVATSPVARRKRKPSSAWDQLALVDAEGKRWAAEFKAFSRLRSRLVSGLDSGVEESRVFELMDLVAAFKDATELGSVVDATAA